MGEERYLFRLARESQFRDWTTDSYQGRVARHVGSHTYPFPHPITTFAVSLLTRTLPTGRLLQHNRRVSQFCPFCFLDTLDDPLFHSQQNPMNESTP